MYTRPDYWLYYPTDHRVPYDKLIPSCRMDYLTGFLRGLGIGAPGREVQVSPLWSSATRVQPGAYLTLGGQVERVNGRHFRAELLRDDVPVAPAVFSCQDGLFLGEYQIPADTPAGLLTFSGRVIGPDGRLTTLVEQQIEVSPDAPPVTRRKRAQPPQPTADELIALNPTLPIAERGREYVIFDMRGVYAERAAVP
jgi:hypothetical protein